MTIAILIAALTVIIWSAVAMARDNRRKV